MWRYLCTDPEIGQNWKINPFRLNLESFTKKCYQKWFKTKKSSFTCNVIDLWIDRIWHNLSDSYKKVLSVLSVHFWLTFVWGPCDWSDVRTPNLALPTLGPSPFMWTSSLRVPQYKCRYILWTDRQTDGRHRNENLSPLPPSNMGPGTGGRGGGRAKNSTKRPRQR